MKKNSEVVTSAAREAGETASRIPARRDAFTALEEAAGKAVSDSQKERLVESFIGIRIVNGKIKDVIADNGAVKIETSE